MAATTYTIQTRPPVRAFAIAAVSAMLGAGLIVYSAASGWRLVLHIVLTMLGSLLLLVGIALTGIAYWAMRRTTVKLMLDDTGYRLDGGGENHQGRWLDVSQVTQSDGGAHVTIYHGPERRTHIVFSRTDQIDAVLDDMRERLKRSRRRS